VKKKKTKRTKKSSESKQYAKRRIRPRISSRRERLRVFER
tara:strand:- start:144 stop:263 length:120 start_codon:yes stop_codon:yes gene_type:complete